MYHDMQSMWNGAMWMYSTGQTRGSNPHLPNRCVVATLHYVQFVKYDVTVSFMAQVLDTVTYLVPQVLDTAS